MITELRDLRKIYITVFLKIYIFKNRYKGQILSSSNEKVGNVHNF